MVFPRESDALRGGLPTGSLNMYVGDTAPQGWLLCRGQAVSREEYYELFNLVGTTFGAGDGTTTFNLPDMQNRMPVGKNDLNASLDTIGETGGEEEVTLTDAQMPSHNHSVDPPATNTDSDAHTHGSSGGHQHTGRFRTFDQGTGTVSFATGVPKGSTAGDDSIQNLNESQGAHTHSSDSHNHSVNIAAFNSAVAGSDAAHNNMPPYMVVNFIIKA